MTYCAREAELSALGIELKGRPSPTLTLHCISCGDWYARGHAPVSYLSTLDGVVIETNICNCVKGASPLYEGSEWTPTEQWDNEQLDKVAGVLQDKIDRIQAMKTW